MSEALKDSKCRNPMKNPGHKSFQSSPFETIIEVCVCVKVEDFPIAKPSYPDPRRGGKTNLNF